MDKLDVIRKAKRLGGDERRDAIVALMIKARELDCNSEVGGGRAGGINVRYGSIGYAIMDVNTKGRVKLYVQPHPNKTAPEELSEALNSCIETHEGLEPKSFPLTCYGHLEDRIEDVPADSLHAYLTMAVELIEETYYKPHYNFPSA